MSRDALLRLQSVLVDEIGASHHFGQAPALPPELRGIDPQRLSLLARVTHAKRLGKIARVLPVTFSVLAPELPALFPHFVDEHPMRDASGLSNALQFYRFLRRCRRRGQLRHAFVPDLAACECALAVVAMREPTSTQTTRGFGTRRPVEFRMAQHVALLRCNYDVQTLLATGADEFDTVTPRAVCLAFVPSAGDGTPRVFELDPTLLAWVRKLRGWQRLGEYADLPVLETLCETGVLECRRHIS
jgi:hypothetical protein